MQEFCQSIRDGVQINLHDENRYNLLKIIPVIREIVSKRSPRTVNQAFTAIQGMYEFHAVEGRIDENKFTKLAHG